MKFSASETKYSPENKGDSKLKKLSVIFGMALLLLIPIAFLTDMISERAEYKQEAVEKIAKSWAGAQSIDTPTMYIKTDEVEKTTDIEPFKIGAENKQGTIPTRKYFELNNYKTTVKIKTEIKKKEIYKVPVYTAEVTQKGDFINKYGNLKDKIIITEISVSDSKGFTSEPKFSINGASPEASQNKKIESKLSTNTKTIPFEITYKIKGLNKIDVMFGGRVNDIEIAGNWENVNFESGFSPNTKNINKKEFSAKWSVPLIAISEYKIEKADSNYNNERYTTANFEKRTDNKASISFLIPVDNYSMAKRALKYSFLFLMFTFIGYFIYEVTTREKQKIHPIQYSLLGSAILIFYLLLVSISEFTSFGISYIISALMILSLIYLYTYLVITKKQNQFFSLGITMLIGILYAFFYMLLSMQDMALLTGSLALFTMLAAIMFLTRNVNWYSEE